MEITVKRIWPSADCVTGVMEIDGQQVCYTLEDAVREIPGVEVAEWKIDGKTAIPRGRYQVKMEMSPRLGHTTPRLVDVPGFDGVLIHGGNTDEDTLGCILVGDKRLSDTEIANCDPAKKIVYDAVTRAEAAGEEVWITVQ